MSDCHDPQDACRHRNLERIGRALALPDRADADRQARWLQAPLPNPSAGTKKGISVMRTLKRLAFATTGIAAALVLGFWLTVGHATPVTAATIFDGLRAALAQSLSMRIADIDFGNVQVSGDIVLDRAGPGPQDDTQYAEVHVLMKADNPAWNDLDAVLVIAQTPTDAWQYCRGNGGSCGGAPGELLSNLFGAPPPAPSHRVTFTEYLIRGRAWNDFAQQPLDQFGAMPCSLGFSVGDSAVSYTFRLEQRMVVEQLLRFLLQLSDTGTADQVIAGLKQAASDVSVERTGPTTYALRAGHFARIGELEFVAPVVPDVSALVRQTLHEFRYDPQTGDVPWTQTSPPAEIGATGVDVIADHRDWPTKQPDALIAYLEARAARVEVDRTNPRQWVFRVTGYPFPTSAAGPEWLGRFVQSLRDSLTLAIDYDSAARTVRRAEFRGIGPAGRITLDIGQVALDPARLKSDYWTTPATIIRDSK